MLDALRAAGSRRPAEVQQDLRGFVRAGEVGRRRRGTIRAEIEAVSRRHDRPVLLTEIGYKSATGAAWRPWEWHEPDALRADPEGQRAIYEAIAAGNSVVAEEAMETHLATVAHYYGQGVAPPEARPESRRRASSQAM